jgi:large subunit ribosomal protein L35Ae
MEAVIINYRRSVTRQTTDEMVVKVESMTKRAQAQELVGKKVVYTTEANNTITGTIVSAHGNSGAVLTRFEKGMPGQAIGKPVVIE